MHIRLTPSLASVAVVFIAGQQPAMAQEVPHMETDKQHCKTGATRADGRRRSCNVQLRIEAPEGHAFLKDSIRNDTVQHRGTGHGCEPPKLEYTESGLASYVVAATAGGNARSDKGAFGGGGRVECQLSGKYGKL